MSDDYKVDGLSDAEIRAFGKQSRKHLKLAEADFVEVLDLETVTEIWTVLGPKPFRLEVVSDGDLPNNSGLTTYDGSRILVQFRGVSDTTPILATGTRGSQLRTNWATERFTSRNSFKAPQCRGAALATSNRLGYRSSNRPNAKSWFSQPHF